MTLVSLNSYFLYFGHHLYQVVITQSNCKDLGTWLNKET